MLTSIETSLALFENDMPQAKVRFHKETGLIIARGTVEQTNLIRDVADQIRESVLAQRDVAELRAAAEELKQSQSALAQYKEQYSIQSAEVDRLNKHIRDLDTTAQDMHQQVRMRDMEISRLQAEMASLRAHLEQANPGANNKN